MKPFDSLLGLVCGAVLMRLAGDAIFAHGLRAGFEMWLSNWVIATGGLALVLGAFDSHIQFFGWITVTLGTMVRMLFDRRRQRGAKADRSAAC